MCWIIDLVFQRGNTLFLTAGREARGGVSLGFSCGNVKPISVLPPSPTLSFTACEQGSLCCQIMALWMAACIFGMDLKVNLMHNSLLVLFLSPAIQGINHFLIYNCGASMMLLSWYWKHRGMLWMLFYSIYWMQLYTSYTQQLIYCPSLLICNVLEL